MSKTNDALRIFMKIYEGLIIKKLLIADITKEIKKMTNKRVFTLRYHGPIIICTDMDVIFIPLPMLWYIDKDIDVEIDACPCRNKSAITCDDP